MRIIYYVKKKSTGELLQKKIPLGSKRKEMSMSEVKRDVVR